MFHKFKDLQTDDEMRSNEALENHATLVMTTLDDAITHIDNFDYVSEVLRKTGASHVRFDGFTKDNFWVSKREKEIERGGGREKGGGGGQRERERHREREREREVRKREREAQRERGTEREKERQRETERESACELFINTPKKSCNTGRGSFFFFCGPGMFFFFLLPLLVFLLLTTVFHRRG